MTVRNLLKCDVCGSFILTRTQIGWLNEQPIRINCGKCGILISGKLILDQKMGNFEFKFENASVIKESEESIPQYYIEISGELLTKKLIKHEKNKGFLLAPFFNSLKEMGEENCLLFKENALQFLSLCQNDWPVVRRINELWLSGNYKYLGQEVEKFLPKNQFPMDNELEFLRGVHQINLIFFFTTINKDRFHNTTKFIWEEFESFSKNNMNELIELAKYFWDKKLLDLYESKIFKQLEAFVDIFPFLLPAFGLQFYKTKDDRLFNEMGITTASFNDLKQFYLDSYEVLGDVASLIIAFNNLKYRHHYNLMVNKRKDVKKLCDFEEKSKGTRLEFLESKEDYNKMLYPYLDNELRNAVGHNSYKYDGVSQLVKYYPHGWVALTSKHIYLLKFAENCWDLYLSLIDLKELVYQTKKIYYVFQGYKSVDPSVFK